MFKKTVAVAMLGFSVVAFAESENYNFETLATSFNQSYVDSTAVNNMAYSGRYYLMPVTIRKSEPFAELDYLQRVSSISLEYSDGKLANQYLVRGDYKPRTINGTFYINDFILALSNTAWDTKFTLANAPAYYYGFDVKTDSIGIGYFIEPKTSVFLNYTKSNIDYSTDVGTTLTDKAITTNTVYLHSVRSIEDNSFLVMDFSYAQIKSEAAASNTNNEYGLSAKYYPAPNYYVMSGYAINGGDDQSAKGKTVTFGLGYLFTPRLGVLISNSTFDVDDSSQKTDYIKTSVAFGYRF